MRVGSIVDAALALLLCGCAVGPAAGPGDTQAGLSASPGQSQSVPSSASAGPTTVSPGPASSSARPTSSEPAVGGVIIAVDGLGWTAAGLQGPRFPAGSCHMRRLPDGQYLPDPRCTPGSVDARVTQATLATTVCRSGYSTSVRPPASLTDAAKRESMLEYDAAGTVSAYEYDHLVPLSLGGSSMTWNLWVEPNIGGSGGYYINAKDVVESALHRAVCSGRVPLLAAQTAIANDWETAESALGL